MWPNPQEPEEALTGKLHFSCSERHNLGKTNRLYVFSKIIHKSKPLPEGNPRNLCLQKPFHGNFHAKHVYLLLRNVFTRK